MVGIQIIYFSALSSAAANPLTNFFFKRNVCNWENAEPILYHPYTNADCPPPITLGSDGNCPLVADAAGPIYENACASFCENSTSFIYGQEQPFVNNPYCHGPLTCSIAETITTTYSWSFSVSPSVKFSDTLSTGVSGGIGGSYGTAIARTTAVTLKEGECGYFTMLPIMKEVCGTYTDSGRDDSPPSTCLTPSSTKVCSTILQYNDDAGWFSDATLKSDTIFVKTNCSNRAPLDPSVQDPAYQHPGVPLDRGLYAGYSNFWAGGPNANVSITSAVTCNPATDTDATPPLLADCMAATANLTSNPAEVAYQGKANDTWWAASSNSCAIEIDYSDDWDSSCETNYAEIFGAVSGIFEFCSTVNGTLNGTTISGTRQLRSDTPCGGSVQLVNTAGKTAPSGVGSPPPSSTSAAPTSQTSLVVLGEGESYCTTDSDCVPYGPCNAGGNPQCITSENTCGCPAT